MARQVASYNLLAIPVVDEENKLVGVITVDDVIDVIKDEATEDIYRLAGVAGDERVFTPPGESLRKRLPWLLVNLGDRVPRGGRRRALRGARSAAWIALADLHADRRRHGRQRRTQTLTVIVRGIALGELTWSNARKALFKETLVGLGNGVALRAGRRRWSSWVFKGDPVLGVLLGAGDDHQHVRGGHGRHADPARRCGR